jgi:predicted dehydrogenase
MSIRCAVVGLGLFGRHHAAVLAASRDADLVLCVDVDQEAEDGCPSGVRFSTELDDLARLRPEAVVVATSDRAHRAAVEVALAAGAAVLCEKPLALSLVDADEMIEAARRHGRTLLPAHTMRFEPRYRAIHDAAVRGELGELIHLSARRATWAPEGRIYAGQTELELCLGVHDLDVMRWCAGEIDRVHAEAAPGRSSGGTADAIVATLRFHSGAIGVLELSWALPEEAGVAWDTQFHCVGTKRSAYAELRGADPSRMGRTADLIPDFTYVYEIEGVPGGVVRVQDEHFLREVSAPGGWPGATIDDARRAVEAALALAESAATGRTIAL